MPAHTASFASAAAGNASGEASDIQKTASSNGDWSRRPNGNTQTFRRPSQLNTSSAPRDNTAREVSTPTTAPYVPPHLNSAFQSSFIRNNVPAPFRYSREQMIEILKSQDQESLRNGLLQSSLNDGSVSGQIRRGEWDNKDNSRDQQLNSIDVCWAQRNSIQPLGLTDMDDEERELFTSSVNSPLKGPTQSNKDGSGVNGRKTSMNQGQGIPSSLKGDRPGPRRRETSDSIGASLGTPTFNRRDDAAPMTPPSSLLRRRTDLKDNVATLSNDKSSRLESGIDTTSPFNSWKRNVSGPMSAGLTGPSSPWASTGPPQSAGFGAFGNFSYEGSSAAPATPGEKRAGFGSIRGESRFKGLMSKDSSEDIGVRSKDKSLLGMGKYAESYLDKQADSNLQTHQEERIGSAALLDDDTHSSSAPGSDRKPLDDLGFPNFGTPSNIPGGRGVHDTHNLHDNEVLGLAGTNPFQSPESDGRHHDSIPEDDIGSMSSFNSRMQARQQNPSYDGTGERAQNSSVGPQRNFPQIGGLGNLSGLGGNSPWSSITPGGFGQSRTNQPFGSGIFSSMADVSSPGGAFGTPSNTMLPSSRSKMGALFAEQVREGSTDTPDDFGTRGSSTSNFPYSSTEFQQPARGVLDDLFEASNGNDVQRDPNHIGATGGQLSSSSGPSPPYGRSPEASQPPPAQQRQMVMPDRIRWIYRDPSGNTQGPFTGLEMHDWYKAGFFSPELQVKKVEEKDYEPLAQLIRRIGNSREPFLVPQIGIPHGPPSAALGTPAGNANLGIQPPFGNSFPSFGTTLTADQQNALERRKQEEQILMARQKEHLQQQQSLMRNMMPNMPFPAAQPSLNHQASVQSLHSQPSFGNISGNTAFQNHPPIGQTAAFERHAQAADSGFGRDVGLPSSFERMNIGPPTSSQPGYNGFGSQDPNHQQQVATMLQDRARIQAQQDQWNDHSADDGRPAMDRFEQFQQLRGEEDNHDAIASHGGLHASGHTQGVMPEQQHFDEPAEIETFDGQSDVEAKASRYVDTAPPSSSSPLPAPAAQRRRQPIVDTLASASREQTPVIETPGAGSVAPWAKETVNSKAPSLLEIQEAESKKAAQQEEAAAALRRQVAVQERIQASQAAAVAQTQAAALPSTANWAAGTAPSSSPWAKTKTMAQIQKEEESRKQRASASAAAAANLATAVPITTPAGKSYATTTASPGAGWSVVGKSKVSSPAPTNPIAAVPARTASSSAVPSVGKPRPTPARSTTTSGSAESFQKWVKASIGGGLSSSINVDDFVKNLIAYPLEEEIISDAIYGHSQTLDGRRFAREFIQRKKDVDKGKAIDSTGTNFTMGGDAKGTNSGWSEVAKKAAPPREDQASTFKVVAAKKKGKR